jgi:predicted type IV restriction endonuclease
MANTKGNSQPQWTLRTKNRLRSVVKQRTKSLQKLLEDDANESTVRLVITEILTEGLGYELLTDLDTEYANRGEFVDYGIRIDRQFVAFVEVKRPSTKLGGKHLKQVEYYAMNQGVEWLWLTNGHHWQVWHIEDQTPIQAELVFEVDFLDHEESMPRKIDKFFYLTKESMKREEICKFWYAKQATSPEAIKQVIIGSHAVLDAIRREIRRKTRVNLDVREIQRVIKSEIFGK